jgi:hypothetical protein
MSFMITQTPPWRNRPARLILDRHEMSQSLWNRILRVLQVQIDVEQDRRPAWNDYGSPTKPQTNPARHNDIIIYPGFFHLLILKIPT